MNSSATKINTLKIAAINANSICSNSRRFDLYNFANNFNHDIIFISETKLSARHKISFKNYNFVRSDRPNAVLGGGTAILLKKDIPFELIKQPSSKQNKILEYTIVKITTQSNEHLFLISAYAPSDNRRLFINELDNLFIRLNLASESHFYILAGDLNARRIAWNDYTDNARGIHMKTWEETNSIAFKAKFITANNPTFIPALSFLDMCIVDARLSLINGTNGKIPTLPYDSDHAAISMEFALPKGDTFIRHDSFPLRYNFKATSWDKFAEDLNDSPSVYVPENRNLSIQEIEIGLVSLSSNIKEVLYRNAPSVEGKNSMLIYVNRKIKRLNKMKSKLLKILHKVRVSDIDISASLISSIKYLLKIIKNLHDTEYKNSMHRYWVNTLKQIDHKCPETFFPKINPIFRSNPPIQIESLKIGANSDMILNRCNLDCNNAIKSDNHVIFTSSEDKLKIIGAYFESINSPRYLNTNTSLKNIVDEVANDFYYEFDERRKNSATYVTFDNQNLAVNPTVPASWHNLFCNFASVCSILKHLPNKCSSGIVGIPAIALKHILDSIIEKFVVLFNNAINHNYFPKIWKEAKVIPVIKKDKDPTNPASYRPISLSPNLSKVYEAIINSKITNICNKLNIFPDTQFGFKTNHSTTRAIHKLVSDINTDISNGKLVGAALLDLEKAFDSVWINGLIFRLIKKKFPTYLIRMIWDIILNKSFVTYLDNNISSIKFRILEGLQQGTVNSPILFNIYICDLLHLFDINQHNSIYKGIGFADDFIIYVTTSNALKTQENLEEIVDKINKYYAMWNLRLNPSKCVTILFRKPLCLLSPKSRQGITNFHIKTEIPGTNEMVDIPHEKSVKYLGYHLDYLMRGNIHLDKQLAKARSAFVANSKLFLSRYIAARTKIILYMILIRPIVTYASPIWWNINHTSMEKLRTFERKCLRACLSLYRSQQSNWLHYISNMTLYEQANITRIDIFIINLARQYFSKLPQNKNELIRSLAIISTAAAEEQMNNGYINPEAFIYCDKQGIIQNSLNIPILYHWRRNRANKRIAFKATDFILNPDKFAFSMRIPPTDFLNFARLNTAKYWWLSSEDDIIRELKSRLLALQNRRCE
ncbi:uncharacterized protein LOC108632312 [Ceratina calcarata]|uniref:Uncharacterized protein LOC108632312 n=1 Tax=Ceratina calcarata TaxID=156304 RepID=A0AAJ7JGL4_9HYME|nr:uncharacterized protein LOC108632312 [Ceratina calcarata]